MMMDRYKATLCTSSIYCEAPTMENDAKDHHQSQNVTYVLNVDVDPHLKRVAVSTSNHNVKLYDSGTSGLLQGFKSHCGRINDIKFSKEDENLLVTCSEDRTAKIWDVRVNRCVLQKKSDEASFGCAALNLKYLIAGLNYEVLVWDLRKGDVLNRHSDFHCMPVTQLDFYWKFGEFFVSGGEDGLVCLGNLNKNGDEVLETVVNVRNYVSKLELFGDGYERFYVLSPTEQLQVGNIQDGTILVDYGLEFRRKLSELNKFELNYLISCKYVHGDLILYAGEFDGKMAVFKLVDRDCVEFVASLSGHESIVRDVFLSPDGTFCVTVGEDSKILFWRSSTKTSLSLKHKKILSNRKIGEPY